MIKFLNKVGNVVERKGANGVLVPVLDVGRLEIEIYGDGSILNLDFIEENISPEDYKGIKESLNELGLDFYKVGDYLEFGDDVYSNYNIEGVHDQLDYHELRRVLINMETILDNISRIGVS